jgi:SNF2 family DNA or RNA helicase
MLTGGESFLVVLLFFSNVDEAHTIKNPKAKMSIACCNLSAQFRWCLTGTPYQNTVDDVYSLVKFLRIPPFCEWDYWRERITKQAKSGNMSLALTRLRTLLRAIMLRRRKEVLKVRPVHLIMLTQDIKLPPKEVISEQLEFDERERKFYNDLQNRGKQIIDKMNSSGGLQKNYMCLLTMLLRLRQATDHMELLRDKVELDTSEDDLVSMMDGLGIEAKCNICMTVYFLRSRVC